MVLNSASVNNFSAGNDIGIIPQDRPKSVQGTALVVSQSPSGSNVVSRMLRQAGYAIRLYSSISQLCNQIAVGGIDESQVAATVLIHSEREDSGVGSMVLQESLPAERVVVLTDSYTEEVIVSLLYSGAHHVFDLHESPAILQVRLEAALRQHSRLASKSFSVGDIHFDVPKRRVKRSGKQVDLSPKEYDLAYYLFSNRDRIVGNNELMTSIWSLPPSMDTRRIDTAACRLRKKLRLTVDQGWELKRLRCVGYRLIPSTPDVSDLTERCAEPLRLVSA